MKFSSHPYTLSLQCLSYSKFSQFSYESDSSRAFWCRECATWHWNEYVLILLNLILYTYPNRKSKDYVYGIWVCKALGIWKGYYRVKNQRYTAAAGTKSCKTMQTIFFQKAVMSRITKMHNWKICHHVRPHSYFFYFTWFLKITILG